MVGIGSLGGASVDEAWRGQGGRGWGETAAHGQSRQSGLATAWTGPVGRGEAV